MTWTDNAVGETIQTQVCPVCDEKIIDEVELNIHVNSHFDFSEPKESETEHVSAVCHCGETVPVDKLIDHEKFHEEESSRALAIQLEEEERKTKRFKPDPESSKSTMTGALAKREVSNQGVTCHIPYCRKLVTIEEWSEHERFHHEEQSEAVAYELKTREEHLNFENLKRQYGYDERGNYKKQEQAALNKQVVEGSLTITEYYEQKLARAASADFDEDDRITKTSDILSVILQFYNRPTCKQTVLLCSPMDHFATGPGDKGWGCGFRNLQMLASSLVRFEIYRKVLFDGNGKIPCIPRLQAHIEEAWSRGFDVAGAAQLGFKLQKTRKWVGATEVAALLRSMGLSAEVIDFHRPTGPNNTHTGLVQYVSEYFSSTRKAPFAACCEPRPPIYLQHQGHSRTIVGVEKSPNGEVTLIVLDPSHT
eukprot:Colp12_sorted_trinity150504_noHs@30718